MERETKNPIKAPRIIKWFEVTKGRVDSIPEVIPTIIPLACRGIITSKAPKKGIKSIIIASIMTIPINPPKSIPRNILNSEGVTRSMQNAIAAPDNVPIKKSAVFKIMC